MTTLNRTAAATHIAFLIVFLRGMPHWRGFGSNSGALQLRVFLDQLLQTEARELYRNLCVFPISFALIDGSPAVFGVLHFLAGAESAFAFQLFDGKLGKGEL